MSNERNWFRRLRLWVNGWREVSYEEWRELYLNPFNFYFDTHDCPHNLKNWYIRRRRWWNKEIL